MNPQTPDALDLASYDFDLPAECIAQRPVSPRDAARLMHVDRASGVIASREHRNQIRDLPHLLRAGDLLVLNVTRVLAARLRGRKSSGGRAEALLLEPLADATGRRYRALVRSSGRLHAGQHFEFGPRGAGLAAELVRIEANGEVVLAFAPGPSPYSLGEAPLPPYIRRKGDERELRASDLERYQTVYARVPGAVAAPTAGLHFTRALLEQLEQSGVRRAEVVLHVGPGTFRPLRPEDLAAARLHAEHYELPEQTAAAIKQTREDGGRVVAVGTTSVRVLETCAQRDGCVTPGVGETDLFLRPGSELRVVDGLVTNFHLPRSSLLLLVTAFLGREATLSSYREAVENGYRFYSYGDAMLII